MGSVHKMAPVSFGDESVCILTSGLATFAFNVQYCTFSRVDFVLTAISKIKRFATVK